MRGELNDDSDGVGPSRAVNYGREDAEIDNTSSFRKSS
jgi:hypothetical protein